MASLSSILQLIDLATGESSYGSYANWGEVTDANLAMLEKAVGEVTSKSVTTLDVTLTATEELALVISASGALTGNRNIITSGRKGFWFVKNACTGAFTLTFKTSAGTGFVVPQGGTAICYCDGTNIVEMVRNTYTDAMAGMILVPANKDYRLALNLPFAGTIKSVTTRSVSGTCTATFKVNTTALGGGANSVSSSETTKTHTSSNTFVAGDDIVLTISANSSCLDMSYIIEFTRALS